MADARETTATDNGDGDGGRGVREAPPPAARVGATISVSIVLLVLLVASIAAFLMSPPASSPDDKLRMEAAGGEGGRAGAEPVEQAVGDGGIPGFNSQLDAVRAWAKLTWMKLRRPHSDEPRYDDTAGSATEAAKKSLEMGKETVELAAATAAEGAAGKAKDKVKGAAAPARPSSSGAEL